MITEENKYKISFLNILLYMKDIQMYWFRFLVKSGCYLLPLAFEGVDVLNIMLVFGCFVIYSNGRNPFLKLFTSF